MLKMRAPCRALTLCSMAAVITMAGTAGAVQRMYRGEMRIGFGDGYEGVELTPMSGMNERIDTANNAVPPCAVDGLTFTPSGMHNKPLTSMGAGPATGLVEFWGLADVQLTAMGAINGALPIQFSAAAATPAGKANWGLVTTCPEYTNGVPGGALFRRTQMATFSWPAAAGTMRAGGGAVPVGPDLSATQALGLQRIGAEPGPNRFGGSVAILGNGDTILGFNPIAALGLPSAIGPLPVPLQIGADGGLSPMGGTIPTGTVSVMNVFFKEVTNPVEQRVVGGPLPPPSADDYPLPAFATGLGFRWTTGVITAYDKIGDFRTTRTRTGSANFAPGPGPTSASLQLVAPSVLRLGITGLTTLGIAVTSELSLRFVPEPASAAMLGAGIGGIGLLLVRQQRRKKNRS